MRSPSSLLLWETLPPLHVEAAIDSAAFLALEALVRVAMGASFFLSVLAMVSAADPEASLVPAATTREQHSSVAQPQVEACSEN